MCGYNALWVPGRGEAASLSHWTSELGDADALICLLNDTIDRRLIDSAAHLRVIANVAVGYENIDVAAARERGIVVTNTPDVLTEATADLTFALVLAANSVGLIE